MPNEPLTGPSRRPAGRLLVVLADKDVLSGIMFILVASLGLWLARDLRIGTALRMGTGYVPRLLCFLLLGLGVVVPLQGISRAMRSPAAAGDDGNAGDAGGSLLPVLLLPASLVAFGLTLEPLGLAVAIAAMIGIAGFAHRELKVWECVAAAVVLIALSWVVFVLGLGLPIRVWPEI